MVEKSELGKNRVVRLVLSAVALLLVFASSAWAQREDPRIPQALEAYRTGDFEGARALFRAAQETESSARVLRGIGLCEFGLENYVEAIRSFERALAEPNHPLLPRQRRSVEGAITRAARFVGRYLVRLEPADAELVLDGVVVDLADVIVDEQMVLAMGTHHLEVRAPGHRPHHQELVVAGGEDTTLQITLVPAEASPPRDPVDSADPSDGTDADPRGEGVEDDVVAVGAGAAGAPVEQGAGGNWGPGWGILALGSAAVVAGVVTGVMAGALDDELVSECGDGAICPEERRDDVARGKALALATDGLLFGGAAVALTGLILALVVEDDAPVRPAVACSSRGCGVHVGGDF